MWQKKFISYEWDAIAGILTAVAAIVLHHLHLLDDRVVMPVFLGLMALLFINFMRHSRNNELTAEKVAHAERMLEGMQEALRPAEVALIGPRRLRSENERFARTMRGDTLWYNVCLSMYAPEPLFDALLRPAIENPQVDSIQFVLDTAQRPLWEQTIQARIMACPGHDKVRPPRWRSLPANVSFIMADGEAGGAEALLSFWGEPFMSEATGRSIPRFVFHVRPGAELLPHLVELARAAAQ
ncbi:MAG: hypothetical protein IT372_01385 [Polyangiaceae bacterium]|jgi:hypothetical protein|nr:hypothetical protein [Rhodocyclaceae bacterium]MCC6551659.1 hypothetical protein [Polyangiaceae bacterium]